MPADLPDVADPPSAALLAAVGPLAPVGADEPAAPAPTPLPAGHPFALSEALADTATGSPLAQAIEALDPEALTAFDLVEVVHAAARMAAWAHALQARYAAALARRPELRPPPGRVEAGRPLTAASVAGQSLSMRLHRSPRQCEALVRDGTAFDTLLPETGDALAAGRIDPPRAQAITSRLHDQHWQVARDVQERVLPRAEHRSTGQVRRDVERALLEVDPEHATERHHAARDRRRVGHPSPEPDGMASFWVHLPAVDALRIDTTLEACARTARAAGDPRTLAQLRADGLVDLLLARGAAPAPAAAAPAPGGGDGAAPDAAADGSPGRADPRTHVFVTVALSTLLDLDDEPAELAGHGPLDAVQARALALGGTWRRIITDDHTGAVLDVGRDRYRPPAALADHVRHRDRTCVAPGCLVPAHLCDLDHTEEFRPDDPARAPGCTSHANLDPLCRHHHRHKTETRLTLRQVEPGTYDWTDPTGHRYRTRPGADAPTEHLTAPGRRDAPEESGAGGPGDPLPVSTGADAPRPEPARDPDPGAEPRTDPPPATAPQW